MYIKQKKPRNRWLITGFFLLFLLIFFNLDVFFPVKHFSISVNDQQQVSFPTDKIKRYTLVYDIYTTRSGLSTVGEKELLEALIKNSIDIAFITDCTYLSSRLEGIYEDKILISGCYTEKGVNYYENLSISRKDHSDCFEIFNLTDSIKFDLLHISSLFKFFIFQLFNKEKAYKQLEDFIDFYPDFDRLSKNPCYISAVGFYSRLKFLGESESFSILDVNYTLPVVSNRLYLSQDLTSDINFSKSLIFNALKDGHIISFFSKDFDADLFILEDTTVKPVGSLVSLENNPRIMVKIKNPDILIVVYKNGKIHSTYSASSVVIKPDKEGFYSFVVYRYNIKLPFGFFAGVRPVAFLGNVFVQ